MISMIANHETRPVLTSNDLKNWDGCARREHLVRRRQLTTWSSLVALFDLSINRSISAYYRSEQWLVALSPQKA